VAKKPDSTKERNPAKRAVVCRGAALALDFIAWYRTFDLKQNKARFADHMRAGSTITWSSQWIRAPEPAHGANSHIGAVRVPVSSTL